jgi:hypothetical protein
MKDNESLERASNTVVPALEKMATPVTRNPLRVPEVDTVKARVRDISPPLPVIDRPVEVIRQVRAASVPVQVNRQTEVSRVGNNSLAEYALLLGRLATAELRLDALEDDFPEDQKGGAGGGAGLDLSLFAFGITNKNKNVLNINSGIISTKDFKTVLRSPQIQLSGNPSIVMARINLQQRSANIVNVSAVPANTNFERFVPMYEFYLSTNQEYDLGIIHHLGSIEV